MKFKYQNFEFRYPSEYIKDILFISVSGSHAYGWNKKDSDLDVRLVWFPNLRQALSILHRGKAKESHFDNVNLVQLPIHHFLRLLVKGNGNSLENLFQEKLMVKNKAVKEIQQLTLENLHMKFLEHYLGYYQTLKKDMSIPSRLEKYGIQKLILSSYRVLRAGIILAKHREVVYNLQKQNEYHITQMWNWILEKYLAGEESSAKDVKDAQMELNKLEKELKVYVDKLDWLKIFPSIVFDNWLYGYYIGEL